MTSRISLPIASATLLSSIYFGAVANVTAQEPAPPDTPTSEAAASDGASASEADALAAALGGSGGTQADTAVEELQEFSLNIYGFADFTYTHRLNDFAYASPYPTFMVGNLNLYAGADLGGGWRSLIEFRVMYLPNGSVPPGQELATEPDRINTTVDDPADYGRSLRWGGVEIERAWLEYSVHSLLTIRGGQWLTPYGIWNVDHGTPVIIGVRRPYVVGEALIPERQTGLQVYGSFLTGRTEIGYDLGLSNGRGPLDAYQDMDENKAFTGRLYVNSELPVGTLNVGGTVYRGTFTDRFSRYANTAAGQPGIEYIATARYGELGLAGDVRWIWEGLTMQGELIVRDTGYDDPLRPDSTPVPGVPNGFAADFRSIGWYVMGAYRLPWWNIMPFVGGEHYKPGVELTQDAAALWGGLNIRPVPRVVLKAQYTHSWFTDDSDPVGDNGLQALDFQAAWSF